MNVGLKYLTTTGLYLIVVTLKSEYVNWLTATAIFLIVVTLKSEYVGLN